MGKEGALMRNNLKNKILSIAILPILLLGIVTIVITTTKVKDALIDEVKDSLKATAAATLAAYDQNSGNYMRAENGNVWKGGYNVSKSESLLDKIKEQSGMDVTFFMEVSVSCPLQKTKTENGFWALLQVM